MIVLRDTHEKALSINCGLKCKLELDKYGKERQGATSPGNSCKFIRTLDGPKLFKNYMQGFFFFFNIVKQVRLKEVKHREKQFPGSV